MNKNYLPIALAAVLYSGLLFAADHAEAPQVILDPAADINDIYTFMNPNDPSELIRTQDLKAVFEENSCLYVFTKASFAAKQRRIGTSPLMFPTPELESIDIDTEFTFRLAELLSLYATRSGSDAPNDVPSA